MPGTWDNLTYTTAADTYTINTNNDYITNWSTKAWTVTSSFVTEERLEKLIRDIYNIILDHNQIDISEEEFLKILEEV